MSERERERESHQAARAQRYFLSVHTSAVEPQTLRPRGFVALPLSVSVFVSRGIGVKGEALLALCREVLVELYRQRVMSERERESHQAARAQRYFLSVHTSAVEPQTLRPCGFVALQLSSPSSYRGVSA